MDTATTWPKCPEHTSVSVQQWTRTGSRRGGANIHTHPVTRDPRGIPKDSNKGKSSLQAELLSTLSGHPPCRARDWPQVLTYVDSWGSANSSLDS